MSLVTRALSLVGLERRSVSGGDPYWSNFASLTGGPVNPATAQGVSAVYACVSAISETIASLPLILYKRDGEGRSPAPDHSLYRVLHDQANENQTALEFREWMQAAVLLRGNAFARIVRGNDGQVRELLPLSPDRVTVLRVADKIAYDYTDLKGVVHRLLSGEVLHLRHRAGDDAVLGVSPIAAAKGVVELAISERDHGNATFKNGARLSGILKFPQTLKAEQRTALKNSWDSQYAGGANSGKTAILESGVEYQTVSMTLEDAEWIAARQFSVEEVARLFRVPPTVIGDLRHGNYSNSVEMARQFVTLTLKRHMVMWEQAIASKLLTDAGRRTYFAEHAVEGLLRGDSTNRAAFYQSGIDAGWLLPSEARRLENLPVIAGIDNAPSHQAA
ncbi:phage portal protein [Polaromonas sp.]|uniref:phage portal protein n=1 Tax=Polaromonas sp. TaxID=1869339 RepID=UPI00248989B0|nr:phage portal protein [Polaromonas sp.]MDI1342414.1 phage portal protein [Polaromonas sp.]